MLMAIKYPTNLLHARTSTHKHILLVHTCVAVKAKRPEQERKGEEEEREKEEEEDIRKTYKGQGHNGLTAVKNGWFGLVIKIVIKTFEGFFN